MPASALLHPDQAKRQALKRAFLRKVGEALLASTKGTEDPERWPAARCADRALGYGNDQQLIVQHTYRNHHGAMEEWTLRLCTVAPRGTETWRARRRGVAGLEADFNQLDESDH